MTIPGTIFLVAAAGVVIALLAIGRIVIIERRNRRRVEVDQPARKLYSHYHPKA